MTAIPKNRPPVRLLAMLGILAFVGGATMFLIGMANTRDADGSMRKITLVAEAMMFNESNPAFHVRPGETIEFLLVNKDKGMAHDIAIPGLKVKSKSTGFGESITVRVTIPLEPDQERYAYICSFHPVTMRGWIVVDRNE